MVPSSPEGHGSYPIPRNLYRLSSSMEWASTRDALYRRSAAVQPFPSLAFSAEERCYLGCLIPDFRGLLFWPSSLDYGHCPPLWGEGSQEEALEGRHDSTTVPETALSHIIPYRLSYEDSSWALPPLLRTIHSRQVDLVSGVFYTYSSISSTTGWAGTAGWATHRVCTTCPCNTYYSARV